MTLVRRRWLLTTALLAAGVAFAYRPIFRGAVIAGRDAFRLFIPYSALILESLRQGELPLWNPYMRLGQPMAAALISQGLYPPAILTAVLGGPVAGVTLRQILHVVIAWFGVQRLGRALRQSHAAASIAATAFALSPLLTDLGGHQNVVDAAAWSGWMAVGWLRLARRPALREAAPAAIFTALSFLAGSPEVLLWQLIACAALVLAQRPSRKAPLVLAALWSLALSAYLLLPAAEFLATSTRGAGRTDQLDWSTSPAQLLALAWPFADAPRGAYWDSPDQWWLVTEFLGATVGALALVSLRRSRRVLPFAACAALFAFIALGSNFALSAALWRVPPLELFRFPAKLLVGIAFCVAVLAGAGLDRALVLARRRRVLAIAAACVTAISALAAGLAGAGLFRKGVALGAPWVWAWCLAAVAILLWVPRRWRRLSLAGLVVAELATFHAFQVGFGWWVPDRMAQPSILAAQLPPGFQGRVSLPVTDELAGSDELDLIDRSRDALVPNRHLEERLHALEGYGAIEPARTDEFHMAGNRSVFDLAGVEYFIRRKGPPYPDLQEVAHPDRLPGLYRSRTAAPRAFVVQRAQVVPDAEALRRVLSPNQLWRQEAFLADGEPLLAHPCEGSETRIVSETTATLELDVAACGDGYLVITSSHYPGWRAEIDGTEQPIHRADYALQAVRVTGGRHHVWLRYRPLSFRIGAAISLLALLPLLSRFRRRGGT
ncbi:MAG TPA: YfhO family protein [Myxococcales bacterium]|nr:YfhO family protein [Myxococcales bacterium]